MTALGQTLRFHDVRRMSGLPPTADISGSHRLFAFGPIADLAIANPSRSPSALLSSCPTRGIDDLACRIAPVVLRSKAGLLFLVGCEVAGGDLNYVLVWIAVIQARARAVIHCLK